MEYSFTLLKQLATEMTKSKVSLVLNGEDLELGDFLFWVAFKIDHLDEEITSATKTANKLLARMDKVLKTHVGQN